MCKLTSRKQSLLHVGQPCPSFEKKVLSLILAIAVGTIMFISNSHATSRTRLRSIKPKVESFSIISSVRGRRPGATQSNIPDTRSRSDYIDPIHGYFRVTLPPECKVKALDDNPTMALPQGIVPCSRVRFYMGSMATIYVNVRKTFFPTVDPQELVALFRRRHMRASQKWIKVDQVMAVEVTGVGSSMFAQMVKFKKHDLDHTIVLFCKASQKAIYGKVFSDFLEDYRSVAETTNGSIATTVKTNSVIGVETPLGSVKEAGVASGSKMRLGNHKVKSDHVFVILKVEAKRRCELVSILDWRLIDSQGRAYQVLGVMTDFGTLFGAESLAAHGSLSSPKTNTFVYEVPTTCKYVDFHIGKRIVGRIPFDR